MNTSAADIIAQTIRIFGDESAGRQAERILLALREGGYTVEAVQQ